MTPPRETPEQRAARQERVKALLDKLDRTRPPWSKLPPWRAEAILEAGARTKQKTLFEEDR